MPPSGVHPLLGRSERMFARPGYVWAGFHSSAVEVSPSTLFFAVTGKNAAERDIPRETHPCT